jgi:hypothetical protein
MPMAESADPVDTLSLDQLREIVSTVRAILWFDSDKERFDPGKEWDCPAFLTDIADELDHHGLRPSDIAAVPVEPSEYTVLLLLPTYLRDDPKEADTELVHVTAPTTQAAIAGGQKIACERHDGSHPSDFESLLVLRGHHESLN